MFVTFYSIVLHLSTKPLALHGETPATAAFYSLYQYFYTVPAFKT